MIGASHDHLHTSNIVPGQSTRELRGLNPSPEYLLPSQWVSVLSPILFTSTRVRIPAHAAPKCDTEPIQ